CFLGRISSYVVIRVQVKIGKGVKISAHSHIFHMRKNCMRLGFVMMFISGSAIAQDTTLHSSFSISFYADAYIAYYADSVGLGNYQKFPSISPRSEQFG